MRGKTICAITAFFLTACTDTVGVQRRYDDVRDACRTQAESTLGGQSQRAEVAAMDEKSRNITLATAFSKCMQGHGWTVASPPPAAAAAAGGGEKAQNNAPSGSPPQQTTAQPATIPPAPRTDLPPNRKPPLENPR